jgi:hypothetical protein
MEITGRTGADHFGKGQEIVRALTGLEHRISEWIYGTKEINGRD